MISTRLATLRQQIEERQLRQSHSPTTTAAALEAATEQAPQNIATADSDIGPLAAGSREDTSATGEEEQSTSAATVDITDPAVVHLLTEYSDQLVSIVKQKVQLLSET